VLPFAVLKLGNARLTASDGIVPLIAANRSRAPLPRDIRVGAEKRSLLQAGQTKLRHGTALVTQLRAIIYMLTFDPVITLVSTICF